MKIITTNFLMKIVVIIVALAFGFSFANNALASHATLTTTNATNITATSATVNGTYNPNNPFFQTTQIFCWFFQRTTNSSIWPNSLITNPDNVGRQIVWGGSTTQVATLNWSGFSPNTAYFFRLAAVDYPCNDFSVFYFAPFRMFTTLPLAASFNLACTNNCNFAGVTSSNPTNLTLSITNTGGSSINWTAVKTQSWLTLSPASGTTVAGGASNITVSVNSAGLTAGNYTDTITITSGGTSKTMSVGLAVGEPLTIVQSIWKIFKKPDLTNPIQSATLSGKVNYTATGLTTADHQASLGVTNSANQTASAVRDFSVVSANSPPSASSVTATQPDYCVSGPAATVNWTYSDPDGNPQSAYQVQVDDTGSAWTAPLTIDTGKVLSSGTSYFTGNSIPPWAWSTTYKTRVRVWDSNDLVSNWSESASWTTPKHAYPMVNFTWSPLQPAANQSIQFTDQTVFGTDSGGVGQRAWNWLFKAPALTPSSTLQNPAYTYTTGGAFNVTETVTDKDSYSCALTKPINIDLPIPIWKEVSPK